MVIGWRILGYQDIRTLVGAKAPAAARQDTRISESQGQLRLT